MQTHTDQRREDALATAKRQLLDGWRAASSHLRKLAQSLGHAQSCACGDGGNDSCRCGVSIETQQECLQCAVLLHTVAWRIDELLDDAQQSRSAWCGVSSEGRANESTARTEVIRNCVEALTRTFNEIDTLMREFGDGCSAGSLSVVRGFATDLLVTCSALDEVLGFPWTSRGRS